MLATTGWVGSSYVIEGSRKSPYSERLDGLTDSYAMEGFVCDGRIDKRLTQRMTGRVDCFVSNGMVQEMSPLLRS